ncbi:MAG TPA: AI-2E family transporter [Bacteroidota bacterium]|nr:AI-2E family transporter [Bacteroidota bacterium]
MQAITSNRPFLKVLFLLGLLLIGFWVASFFPDLVLALIASILVAFMLKPLVKFLEFRLGLRRSLAILLVFLIVGGSTVLAAMEIVPFIVNRVQGLYDQFKTFPFDQKLLEASQDLAEDIPFFTAEEVAAKTRSIMNGGIQAIGSFLENVVGLLVTLSIVPFITYFILAEGDIALKKLIERVPNKYFEMTMNVLYKIQRDLVGYLRGWILDSIIIGILSIVGLMLIGIDYPFIIGTIAGIANLVPYLGPIVGAVPAFLVSLTQYGDFRMLVPIVILTVTIQAIDNIIVQPVCFSKSVDMHPLTVIIVLVIGNQLMGVAGMILGIPIATILKASAEETYWGLKNYRITA